MPATRSRPRRSRPQVLQSASPIRPLSVVDAVALLRAFVGKPAVIDSATWGGMGSQRFVRGKVKSVEPGLNGMRKDIVVVTVIVARDLGSTVPSKRGNEIREGLSLEDHWQWEVRPDGVIRVFKPKRPWEGWNKILLGTNVHEPSEN